MLAGSGPVRGGGSEWFARAWQSDEGLPDNSVVGLAQSADGFLWVATQSGLARFDGVRFRETPAVNAAGVPTSLLHALFLDHLDRLWIAKARGVIICWDHGRMSVFTPKDGLPMLAVRMMTEDRQGGLWVSFLSQGFSEGLVRIFEGKILNITAQDGIPAGGTCQLAADKAGQIWIAKAGQFGVWRNGKFVKLLNLGAQRIVTARAGGVWIYSLAQLFKYTEEAGLVKLGDLPVNRRAVNATLLYEDRAGAVWIGTVESGLFRYADATFATVKTSHHEILSMTEDREGNIWVGTRGGGLDRLQPRSLDLVDVSSGLESEAIRSICQDSVGDVWAVTQSGVVARHHGTSWENLSTNAGWPIQYAQCVAAMPAGGVWIGTQYLGLFSWQQGKITNVTNSPTLGMISVRALLSTPSGDLWIGTETTNALQRLRAGRLRTFDLPAGSGNVTAMALDASGNFWAGTSAGLLLRCSEETIVNETPNTLMPEESIRTLCATADGSLWIGYGGRGVGRLKGEGFTQFGTEQGLHDNYISRIISDDHDRLWFAGNLGIFYVPMTEFDAVAEGRSARVRSVVYGKEEGLPNLQASYGFWPGAIRKRNGDLCFPMLTGLATINVKGLRQNLNRPPSVIVRVAVDGRTVAAYQPGDQTGSASSVPLVDLGRTTAKLRLQPDHQRVDIEFAALSFTAPRNVAFRYMLEGLDKDWVDGGSKREVPYNHIPAGDYTFRVAACNELGEWSEPEARVALKVLPFFWQTWTFRILAFMLSAALISGSVAWSVRLRHRRKIEHLERQRATERERARIAQDLHDDLGSGLTEISFGSEFAQDSTIGKEAQLQHTQEIGARARELVAALDEIVWAVNPKNDTVASLASYLCLFAERFLKPTRLRLRLKVTRSLPEYPLNAEERHNLFLAFKEALNNVVQHAKATEISLTIDAEGEVLLVVVADDGCGFDPSTARSEADGLGNMRRRLAQIAGSCELSSSLEKGTAVGFKLPLRKISGTDRL